MSKTQILSMIIGAASMVVTPMEWPFYRRVAAAIVISLPIILLAIIVANIKEVVL